MRIEKVSLTENAQLLYEMDIQSFTKEFDYPARDIKDTETYLKGCEIYLVYIDSKVIGSISYKDEDGLVEIKQVIVLPPFQGGGYGREMVQLVINQLKGKKLWLVTHPKNTAAIITYLKAGFIISAWKENYNGDGQPRLLFRYSA